jgi:hypothetical protein
LPPVAKLFLGPCRVFQSEAPGILYGRDYVAVGAQFELPVLVTPRKAGVQLGGTLVSLDLQALKTVNSQQFAITNRTQREVLPFG